MFVNFYNTFKRLIGLRSRRIKLILIAAARQMGMRYIGVFIDPVIACNIRCKMCYFSDPAKRPSPEGVMTSDQIFELKRSVLSKALKMQIGCGAEPTIYRQLPLLIQTAKEAKVPYIEITTNGQLLTVETLKQLIDSGLNGMTLSLHGTTKETYEYLMEGAKFDKLLRLIESLKIIRKQYPDFQLRINYTVNNLNKNEILNLWTLFDGMHIDVLQIRPIQKLGDTAYNDFVIKDYEAFVDDTLSKITDLCKKNSTITLLPSKENIKKLSHKNSILTAIMEEVTYCYVSPKSCYRPDFNPDKENIKQYQTRSGIARKLLKGIFSRHLLTESEEVHSSKKLNYN